MHIKNPTAPMPNFGFSDAQIGDIVAYLSTLDGGAGAQSRPIVAFDPASPSTQATISVTFPGTPPQRVTALPIMQMGTSTMQTHPVTLVPSPQNPQRFTGRIEFSMGGPWTVHIDYDGNTLIAPINVGSST
jgi:hypothetical protein